MANGKNLCIFIGNLGKDPELVNTNNGVELVKINLAINSQMKKNDKYEDVLTWVPIVFFGKRAKAISEYAKKGTKLYIEGRFNTQKYEKDGEKRYSTSIIGDNFIFLDSKEKSHKGKTQTKNTATYEDDEIPF